MRTNARIFIFLVILVIILTSVSTGYDDFSLKGTNTGIEDTGSIELAEVYYEQIYGEVYDVYVSGDYAYVASIDLGLVVLDISDPTNPGTPYNKSTTGGANGVFVSGDYAYLADRASGLAVINISDPTNPGTPVYEDTAGSAYDVFVSGDYAYIADYGRGLAVIDISDPTNPGTPYNMSTTGNAHGVFVSGDYAYLACLASGISVLAVIDISDPTNPGTPVYEDTDGQIYDVFVSGDYAYVADGPSGLAVIDILDPTNPGTPVYEDTSDYAIGVHVSGDYAYVANYESGLAVIDISDPTNPGTPVFEDTTSYAVGVFVRGDYAYMACVESGLAVIDVSSLIPTTTTTTTTGTGPDPTMAILVTGGGAAVIAIIAALFIVKKRRPSLDEILEAQLVSEEVGVQALRGCAAVGGRFDYKVKVINNTNSVITNAAVMILSYPEDCLELSGEKTKTLKRIGPGEFRSPQFTFVPTKDCVEGRVVATVSYIDYQDRTHTLKVEPYLIRSVCDLLEPVKLTMQQFDLIIGDMEQTSEELTLPWNPDVLFSKVLTFLPLRNFHIVDSSAETIGAVFTGKIHGVAEGKYTNKKVAIRILISGEAVGNESSILITGLGEDMAMLPTTIEELRTGFASWTCMNCGAAFGPDDVIKIKSEEPVQCRYCKHTMTIELYKK